MTLLVDIIYFIIVLIFLDFLQKIEIFDTYIYHYDYIKNTINDRKDYFMRLDFQYEYNKFKAKDKLLFKGLKYKTKLDKKFLPRVKNSLINQGIDVTEFDEDELLVALVIATKKIYRKD